MKTDVLVIGGGLSGLSAALGAQRMGAQTTILAAGMGVLYLSSGCIDLMAYPGGEGETAVDSPLDAIARIRKENPGHPYANIDDENLCRSLDEFVKSCQRQRLTMFGDGTRNFKILTALGTARPTALVPASMAKGDLDDKSPIALIGFSGLRDFFPEMVAAQVKKSFEIPVQTASFDPKPFMEGSQVNTVSLGRAFESLKFCGEFAKFINYNTSLDHRIGIPAALGVDGAAIALHTLEELTGCPVFEIPLLPPSLPGRRVYQALKRDLFEQGGQLINGCPVVSTKTESGKVFSVKYKAGGIIREIDFGSCVLATGSFFSGGLLCQREKVSESIFDLPIQFEPEPESRFKGEFLAKGGHPVGKSGIKVDSNFRPCDNDGAPVFLNLFACGDILGGFDSLSERSGGGVAIASGTISGELAAKAALS